MLIVLSILVVVQLATVMSDFDFAVVSESWCLCLDMLFNQSCKLLVSRGLGLTIAVNLMSKTDYN